MTVSAAKANNFVLHYGIFPQEKSSIDVTFGLAIAALALAALSITGGIIAFCKTKNKYNKLKGKI